MIDYAATEFLRLRRGSSEIPDQVTSCDLGLLD